MALSDIFINLFKNFDAIQGVERDLLKRKRAGTIGWLMAVIGAIHQILTLIVTEDYKKEILKIFTDPANIKFKFLIGFILFVIGLGIYFIVKHTKILLKKSQEPFHYTFWIEKFTLVPELPDDEENKIMDDERLYMLHHDLMERLNNRIKRLSLLKSSTEKADKTTPGNLTSHIHIEGHYAIRQKNDEDEKEWIVQVMPRVRIGPSTNPSVLATPVKFFISIDNKKEVEQAKDKNPSDQKENKQDQEKCKTREHIITVDEYNQIVERLYSSVATEIYRQIEQDLQDKVTLFPTLYTRACAYYYEAEDFARSNTIDAYDRAIVLYQEAFRYFDISRPLTNFFFKLPILWRTEVKFVHMRSKVKIGQAKCLIYRRQISSLSGQYKNPLFGIRNSLDNVINNLRLIHNRINGNWRLSTEKKQSRKNNIMAFLTFPKDSWWRIFFLKTSRAFFDRQNHLLFDAYLIAAYIHHQLGAMQKAAEYLENARAVDPQLSEKSALFHLVSGVIEPDPAKALILCRKATEIAPEFQIAQYLLANYSEIQFRRQNELVINWIESVIKEYERVLELNPGNISSLAAQGYIYWLLVDPEKPETLDYMEKAKKKFEKGCEVKAMVRETFIGQLNYGLARIAAEEGKFDICYDKYNEAILADPGVAAYSATSDKLGVAPYFDYIDTAMLKRFHSFKKTVEVKIEELKSKFSEKTIKVVHSFVLNDYGNACLNYFHHTGEQQYLDQAIDAFNEATEKEPQNKIVFYNLANAYEWLGEIDQSVDCLEKADNLEPVWSVSTITLAKAKLSQLYDKIKKIIGSKEDAENRKKEIDRKLERSEGELEKLKKEKQELKDKKKKFLVSASGEFILESSKKNEDRKAVLTEEKPSERERKVEAKIKELELEIEDLKKEQEIIKKTIAELEKELKNKTREKNYESEVFLKIEQIIKKTKLSAIYEGYRFDVNGQGVDIFLSQKEKIEKEKFDESDVQGLMVLADMLSKNEENEKAKEIAERLCEYIEEYWPENFDVCLLIHSIYKSKIRQIIKNSFSGEKA